ncbi:MAG TPA: hypothetical protein VGP04_12455, partial [Pseudonocardiaceae bacterium]|nr:hypothetical protein [Pseudonocardiaceae bacterium]
MTRRPNAMTASPGVHIVYGDCEDPASLDAAFDGVNRAFLMSAQNHRGTEGTELLPIVAQALGRPPVSFAQWATAHAALFT